jgi:hypothetical protein
MNGRGFHPCYFHVFADVRGVAYLEDAIIMLDIFLFLW